MKAAGRLHDVAYSADGKTMFVSDSGAFAIRTADRPRNSTSAPA